MEDQFKNVEIEFKQLRDEFKKKKISEPDFKKKLKELRLQDKEGRFWTIGAQTGRWYYFDGNDWTESKPPSLEEKRAICVHCGFENDLENEACSYCGENLLERKELGEEEDFACPSCGKSLDRFSFFCPDCDRKEEEGEDKDWELTEEIKLEPPLDEEHDRDEQVLRSIQPFSLALFFGALGLLAGIIIGAFAGATDFLPGVIGILPPFLGELHGSLMGGLFYGLFGGIFGFLAIGLIGFLIAMIFNVIFSFIGGIKLHIE